MARLQVLTGLVCALLLGLPAGAETPPEPRPAAAPEPAPVSVAQGAAKSGALIEPEPIPPGALAGAPYAGGGLRTPHAICGNARILGIAEPNIPVDPRGCGIAAPMRVSMIAGVRMQPPALIDCPTAVALHEWITRGVKPALRQTNNSVVALQIRASFDCTLQDGIPNARPLAHAIGRAVDVDGFILRNGTVVSVLTGWGSPTYGEALSDMMDMACKVFRTAMGPASTPEHRSHFHLGAAPVIFSNYCR